MKTKMVLVFALLMAAVAVNAQDYKQFRVGLGVGYARPGGEGAKGGVLFYLEPGYRINDQILVGLRYEAAAMIRGFSEDVGDAELEVAGIGSYTLFGQYYFGTSSFRPFVGLGLGIFQLAAVKVDGAGEAVAAESKFAFYPRVGFDIAHFTLALDYNIIGATKPDIGEGEFKNSYLGVHVGFFIGGGKNK